MNHSEAARLLGAMASFDRRTVGDTDVIAWQAILDDVPFADALEAVKQHYREGEAWLMPVHVRKAVRAMQAEREAAARSTGWAPGQAGVPKDQPLPELSDGPVAEATRAAAREMLARWGVTLHQGSREALMPRTVAWEREHRAYLRTRDAEPNPLYRPQRTCPVCGAAVVPGLHWSIMKNTDTGAETCDHRQA